MVELREFYHNPAGRTARRLLCARVAALWPHVAGERILVLGYGPPMLRPWLGQAHSVHAFMPAGQGVAYWPREGPNISCLVDPTDLPLPDASIDRVVLLHALEAMPDPAPMLREIWRVLKSGGRLLTVAPNRRGFWAHNDRTPFGNGQPYSPRQARSLLHGQGFLIERLAFALYAPPGAARFGFSFVDRVEKIAARLFSGFGGVLLIEAGKQLYAPRVEKKALRHRLVLPLPLPAQGPVPAGRFMRNNR
ncbi:MAG: methyltransferase domain-containing protein [Alphaproteobacteria bacterium]|nr:methyltransferase domain-containing protein [Alphaproteobacteria bacterium]